MKYAMMILAFAVLLLVAPACPTARAANWTGVDEAVIGKVAEKAGRPAREPFINTDRGDLLLFVFLAAGIAGGFVAGYYFRVLFPPRRRTRVGREASPSTETARTKEAG